MAPYLIYRVENLRSTDLLLDFLNVKAAPFHVFFLAFLREPPLNLPILLTPNDYPRLLNHTLCHGCARPGQCMVGLANSELIVIDCRQVIEVRTLHSRDWTVRLGLH